jgi:hypothetical protein
MSGKNRAFALAVATAALVGMSAPVASAATFQGGPSGFNNDSVYNLSGNQLPVQTCNGGDPVNTVTNLQTITADLGTILPTAAASPDQASLSTGDISPAQGNNCTQNSTQTNTTTANTAPTPAASEDTDMQGWMSWSDDEDQSSDPSGPSGFNNDSVLNLSGNQLPVQTCTGGDPVNTVTNTQTLAGALSVLPVLTAGAISPAQGNACTQTSTQTNTTTANT